MLPCPLLLPTASMNASTAGDSAASGRTVGGRRVNTGGCGGRGPFRARMPRGKGTPGRLERNHASQAAMAATAASPALPPAAADAPPATSGWQEMALG